MFFNFLKSDTTKPNNNNNNNKAMEDVVGDEVSHSGASSPYIKSPWSGNHHLPLTPQPPPPPTVATFNTTGLVGSLVREEGHVYSLAASGDLLYAGSESKNIRVWRKQDEFSGFKSASGFVKAIVVTTGDRRVFTGHQDGKIRVWRASVTNPAVHKRVGSLPKLKDCVKSSFNPSNYVDVRRHRSVLWLRHFDAVSCLSLSEDEEVLYSGSWDRTIKVWSTSNLKCLESIDAHQDAVNSVATGFGGLVFSGSADGTVKVWRRKFITGKATEHSFVDTLLKQESAVTSLAVMNSAASVLYCGSSDGVVNFREMEKNLTDGGVLRGHRLAVLCLQTAGPLVMSGSADKTICVWRRGSDGVHSCLSVLSGHLGPVKCLAVDRDHEAAEDGKWVVYSGSLDRSVKIWKVSVSVSDGGCRNIFRH